MAKVITPKDEHSSTFLAKRWDNTRKNMEDAQGTKDFPRLAIEHDIAGLHYKLALEREHREALEKLTHQQAEVIGELSARIEQWDAFIADIPKRMTILEGAYAHISMVAHGHSFASKMIEAYEMGKKAK